MLIKCPFCEVKSFPEENVSLNVSFPKSFVGRSKTLAIKILENITKRYVFVTLNYFYKTADILCNIIEIIYFIQLLLLLLLLKEVGNARLGESD